MKLLELYENLFQYICRLNRASKAPTQPEYARVRSEIKDLFAEVERSAETTIIVVKPPLAGCEPFRYVIRNDGTGGMRYNLREDRWKPDGMDHDLTPAK